MLQGETPEKPRQTEDNGGGDHQLKHELAGLSERFDQKPRGDIRDNHYGNDPAEDEAKNWGKYDVGITSDVEKIEIAVNQPLGAHDPEADGGEAEHDRVMHRHPETKRDQVKQDCLRSWDDAELGQRDTHHGGADDSVDNAVQPKLFRGNSELTIDWQNEERVQFSCPHQLGDVGHIHEEKRLKKLRNDLVRADEQYNFPLGPITDAVDVAEDNAEEDDLAAEPEDFHQHPEEKICFEAHLADKRVAQHDGIDFDVTPHPVSLSFTYMPSQLFVS
jgi:hypothetical protein